MGYTRLVICATLLLRICSGCLGKADWICRNGPRGIDDAAVEVEHTVKSISQEITFEKDISDREVLIKTIKRLSAQVGSQLRKQGFTARTIRIKIRWANFETHTRQISYPLQPIMIRSLVNAAIDLFRTDLAGRQESPIDRGWNIPIIRSNRFN